MSKNIEKKFPLKILDNFYVAGISNSSDCEREAFLQLNETDIFDKLIEEMPDIRKRTGVNKEYTPSFGKYIISNSPETLKFHSEYYAKRKAEELFANFEDIYCEMIYAFTQFVDCIYSKS